MPIAVSPSKKWGRGAPVASSVPAYIDDLSPYQVRKLTGTYAPTNGNETILAATPSTPPNDWVNDDPGSSNAGGLFAYSGGSQAVAGNFLDVQGGGHQDSANNGTYRFDVRGTSAPTGWTVVAQSLLTDVPAGEMEEYDDGKPPSWHTYSGLIRVASGVLYRFSGGKWSPAADFTKAVWKLNPATETWTRLSDIDATYFGAGATAYDAVTNKIFAYVTGGGNAIGKFWNCNDDTVSASKTSTVLTGNMSMAFDTLRGQGLYLGATTCRLCTLDFSAETASFGSELTGDVAALAGRGLSVVYADWLDAFIAFGGDSTAANNWTHLYRINANTLAVTDITLTGGTMVPQAQVASFGRFLLRSDWRALFTAPAYNLAVAVIRLPSS